MIFRYYITHCFVIFTGIVIASLIVSCAEPTAIKTISEEVVEEPTITVTTFSETPTELPATHILPSETVTEPPSPDVTEIVISPTATDIISDEVVLEYLRRGGFVGFDDYLSIDGNLQVTIIRQSKFYEFELNQKSFEEIQQQFDKAEFSKLEKEYLPKNTCCDLIEYTIIYQGHRVETMDTAVPESLQSILDSLNQIIKRETNQ